MRNLLATLTLFAFAAAGSLWDRKAPVPEQQEGHIAQKDSNGLTCCGDACYPGEPCWDCG